MKFLFKYRNDYIDASSHRAMAALTNPHGIVLIYIDFDGRLPRCCVDTRIEIYKV